MPDITESLECEISSWPSSRTVWRVRNHKKCRIKDTYIFCPWCSKCWDYIKRRMMNTRVYHYVRIISLMLKYFVCQMEIRDIVPNDERIHQQILFVNMEISQTWYNMCLLCGWHLQIILWNTPLKSNVVVRVYTLHKKYY